MHTAPLIAQAFAEDLPRGDLTTDLLKREFKPARIALRATEDLVLAGRQIFEDCLRFTEPTLEANWQFRDGDFVLRDQVLAWFKASPKNILRAERVALNFLGHLTGIATLTRCYVRAAGSNPNFRIEPTRAGTPGMRALERAAVKSGGGHGGRENLSETCVIGIDHKNVAGSLEAAFREIRAHYSGPLEVECQSVREATFAREAGAMRLTMVGLNAKHLSEVRGATPSHVEVGLEGRLELSEIGSIVAAGANFVRLPQLISSAPAAEVRLDFASESRRDLPAENL